MYIYIHTQEAAREYIHVDTAEGIITLTQLRIHTLTYIHTCISILGLLGLPI